MAFTFQRHIGTVALTAALAALTLPVLAQPAPSTPVPASAEADATKAPRHAGERPMHHRHADKKDGQTRDWTQHRAKRAAMLKGQLALTDAQEPAWTAFTTSMQPGERTARLDRSGMEKLTTPERIDRMRALRAQHAARQHLGLDHEAQDPLAPDRLGQRAVRVASGRHPAQRFFLGRTAFQKRCLGQGFFYLRQLDLPLRRNAVHDHVFEHGKPLVVANPVHASCKAAPSQTARVGKKARFVGDIHHQTDMEYTIVAADQHGPERPPCTAGAAALAGVAVCSLFNSYKAWYAKDMRPFWHFNRRRSIALLVTTLHSLIQSPQRRYMGGRNLFPSLQRSLQRTDPL